MRRRKKLIIAILVVILIGLISFIAHAFFIGPDLTKGEMNVLILASEKGEQPNGAVDMAFMVHLVNGSLDNYTPVYPGGMSHPSKPAPGNIGGRMMLHDCLWDGTGVGMENAAEIVEANTGMHANAVVIIYTDGLDHIIDSIRPFYVDGVGTLHIKGDGSALDITANSSITSATSRITQTENDITAIVSRDGNGTIISLDSNKVKIAWNNISQYMQFDTVSNRAGLSIYNSSSNRVLRLDNAGLNINNNSGNDLMKLNTAGLKLYGQYDDDNNTYLLMSLDSQGQRYYYKQDSNNEPIMVGRIGTNSWVGDSTFRGLQMGLKYGGSYLAWSHQDTENGNYTVKIVYFATDSDKGNEGVHLKDTTYLDYTTYCGSYLWLNDNVRTIRYSSGDAGIYSSTHGVSLEGTTALVKGTDGSFKIENGAFNLYNSTNLLVNCYNNLDMQNYAINNATINSSSDVRMKTNIADTDVNAIDILNQIEMKKFDWRTNNKHEDIGIIAQQLQEVLPDLVYEDELTTKLSIQPIKFIPYLIKAIQELSAKIDGDKKPKTKNKSNNKKYSFSKEEIDGFLKRITPKSVPNHRQIQEEEEIKLAPIYLENQFKSKEREDKKK